MYFNDLQNEISYDRVIYIPCLGVKGASTMTTSHLGNPAIARLTTV